MLGIDLGTIHSPVAYCDDNNNSVVFEVNRTIESVSNRLSKIHSDIFEYKNEIDYYEREYYKANRLPEKNFLFIYLFLIFASLFANLIIFISFASTMTKLVEIFIVMTTIALLIDGTINLNYYINIRRYFKYKNIFILEYNKFSNFINCNFINGSLMHSKIDKDPKAATEYFLYTQDQAEKMYISIYNAKVRTLNSLIKFNNPPEKGYYLGIRMLILLVCMIGFYFITLRFFPTIF